MAQAMNPFGGSKTSSSRIKIIDQRSFKLNSNKAKVIAIQCTVKAILFLSSSWFYPKWFYMVRFLMR
ncbi:unnamed protein product [Brassica oleracea]